METSFKQGQKVRVSYKNIRGGVESHFAVIEDITTDMFNGEPLIIARITATKETKTFHQAALQKLGGGRKKKQ